jgi:uncharacterized membrane protein YkvI
MARHGGQASWSAPIEVAAVLVGGLIGAGYASGRELHEYFGRHGAAGLGGLALAGALIAAFSGWLLDRARRSGTRHYADLLRALVGDAGRRGIEPLIGFGLFVSLAVTLAGGASLAGGPAALRYGSIALFCLITFALALAGSAALLRVSVLLVPAVLLLLWHVAGGAAVASWPRPSFRAVAARDGVLYFLYNDLLALALVASLGQRLASARQAFAASSLAASVLVFTAAVVLRQESLHPESLSYDMPLLHLAAQQGPAWGAIYGLCLTAALLTTAVACAVSLHLRLGRRWLRLAGVIALAGGVASAGFVPLVRYAYPLVACAGAATAVVVLVGSRRTASRCGQ